MAVVLNRCSNFASSFCKEMQQNTVSQFVVIGVALLIIGIIGLQLCTRAQINFWDHTHYLTHAGPLMALSGLIGVSIVIAVGFINVLCRSCNRMKPYNPSELTHFRTENPKHDEKHNEPIIVHNETGNGHDHDHVDHHDNDTEN